ncbi:hypothetical protein LDENG_00055170 [Lucifuga dentata]|nr:hypothetical protein LDENG_00055170 [Lucifuga dentata]
MTAEMWLSVGHLPPPPPPPPCNVSVTSDQTPPRLRPSQDNDTDLHWTRRVFEEAGEGVMVPTCPQVVLAAHLLSAAPWWTDQTVICPSECGNRDGVQQKLDDMQRWVFLRNKSIRAVKGVTRVMQTASDAGFT